MELELWRYSSGEQATLGVLFELGAPPNGRRFLCFTLEDEYRAVKVAGSTRIPAGRYRLALRTEGGFHGRYSDRFPDIHKGMLHVLDVPGFTWILVHVGNDDEDTDGCILVGDTAQQNVTDKGMVGASVAAYRRIYPRIAFALLADQEVWLNVVDGDVPTEHLVA